MCSNGWNNNDYELTDKALLLMDRIINNDASGENMAPHGTITSRAARISGFLGLQADFITAFVF
jgi:hypothetical protein